MNMTPLSGAADLPVQWRPLLAGAKLHDRSCSRDASVAFVEKDGGYFLKSAAKGTLADEAALTRWFHGKGLAAEVLGYVTAERDWLLTKKLPGDNCIAAPCLEQPEMLCDTLAELLRALHQTNAAGCPVANHAEQYIARAAQNFHAGRYDPGLFPDNWGYATPEEAFRVVETQGRELCRDTLLHGDYCLPNIILDGWRFSGFVDLGNGGVGDRHVDLFWALWSLAFNLKTNAFHQRFIDVYGRADVDEGRLRIVAAIEVFG